jgi:hypothetical protein
MKDTKNYQIICREDGTIICSDLTLAEAENLVANYEMEDFANGEYDENFYEISKVIK